MFNPFKIINAVKNTSNTISSFIKRPIEIKELENYIRINNIQTYQLITDIKSYWKTDKIKQNFFKELKPNYLEIYNFYIPDFIYILKTIVSSGKRRYLSINTCSQIKELLLTNTIFKSINEEYENTFDYSKLDNLKLQPLVYQKEFLDIYNINKRKYHLNGYLLAASAGSGKTANSLMLYHLLNKKKCIILCPTNAVNRVWENHIVNKVFKQKKSYSTSLSTLDFNSEFLIIHYEYLSKVIDKLIQLDSNDTMIILDESHNFNEIKSQRTELFINLCINSKIKDILLLSGTPIKATPHEAIPLFRCIDPLFSEDVLNSFKSLYRQNNTKGTDILSNRLGLVSFKVQKDELGLKEPILKNIKIKIPNAKDYTLASIRKDMEIFIKERTILYEGMKEEVTKIYNQVLDKYTSSLPMLGNNKKLEHKEYVKDLNDVLNGVSPREDKTLYQRVNKYELDTIYPFIATTDITLANQWKDIRTLYKYPHLKIQGECLGIIVGGARIKCHVDMVKYIPFTEICESSEKKTVVFTSFTEVIEECINYFPKIDLQGVFIYAKTNKNLNQLIKDFDKKKTINPLVATYKSLSTAVPLTMADNMILIDSPYRDYILQQAISRIHRLDSDTQTTIYILELDTEEANISTRSKEILEWSQKQIKEIIGIKSPFMLDNIEDTLDLTKFNTSLESYTPTWMEW